MQTAGWQRITLRHGDEGDALECGRICYAAFKTIAQSHGFTPDFTSVEAATEALSSLLKNPKFYSVIAEIQGKTVGSNFMDQRSAIAGIGPITVEPSQQNSGIGRELMQDVLAHAEEAKFVGVRLVQAAYHGRSLSLYTKLGFITRETLSVMQGPAIQEAISGLLIREATESDLKKCNEICKSVHGIDRGGELQEAISNRTALIVEKRGKITGYSTALAFVGHSVAKTNEDMMALIGCGKEYRGPGIIVPTRNHELFKWCLERGLRVTEQLTLMTIGTYNEPAGTYLPSILY